ncbi:hypothetical protein MAM1_0036d02674 [Mucor ambiguus]|uniref:Arrestin C-terminal-like domain-containing protein n=1 Tax=Mucor ambiguus TaxID=91626 RepID=A0A0C9MMT2_9FUNG|nr:hypothetical protein MAM1_0036d02674 [Mucor ambiguus]
MVRPILSIRLKESHSYYSQDETIPCIVDFKSEKVLKEGFIRIQFMGRSSSYCNGSRQHLHNIFTVEKEIKIDEWNNAANIKKMHQVEFTVEVPNGKDIPSYRNVSAYLGADVNAPVIHTSNLQLEGSDGGKIEYMIEASFETPGGLFKKSNVLANHIIQVPLIAKVNITENGLERNRESSIRWPKIEDNINTCALSARIPHEGWVRGKEVPVHIDFQQPERFQAVKSIKVALVQQEIIASSKDKIPEMTKQLPDRIIKTEDKPITMTKDMYNPQLLTVSSLIMATVPSNATPTISGTMAKVMRIDYKIRVTVNITGAESDKEKTLDVNLPLVVGTAGQHPILHDSGVDTTRHNEMHRMSYNPYGSPYPPMNMNAPYPLNGGGFQMPDPFQVHQQQPYPPAPQQQFMLNPQYMSFTGTSNTGDYEGGMPVPKFSASEQTFSTAASPVSDQTKSFVYPPLALSSQMSTLSVSTNPFSSTAHVDSSPYPPTSVDKAPTPTSTNASYMPFSPSYEKKTDAEIPASSLSRESTRSTVHSGSTISHPLYPPPSLLSVDKPNTPTPPQTPAVINRNISQQRPISRQIESGSSYHSGVSVFDDASYSSSPPQASHIATRIDPLEGTIVLSNGTNK